MIRKFIPPIVLTVGAWLCVLACVGALAAACAIGLSSLWGPVRGCLATAGLFAILALFFLLAAKLSVPKLHPPGARLAEQAEDYFRGHQLGILAATAIGAFVLARSPRLILTATKLLTRSTAFLVMLKKLSDSTRR